jgi:hypothetical protein
MMTSRFPAVAGLRTLIAGADPPRPTDPRRLAAASILATAATAYLAYGAASYLDLKSGLPYVLCLVGGLALAAPATLVVTRPLLAWRLAWVTAVIIGPAVQAHDRTPFSWHPAVFVAQLVILVVVALRLPFAVSAWAWASMALLITLSFYPADRAPLIGIVAALMGAACLIRRRRLRKTRAAVPRPQAADG